VRAAGAFLVIAWAAPLACVTLSGVEGVTYHGDAGGDASDASAPDAKTFTYQAKLADPSAWETFNVSDFANGDWHGALFDGRYLTFVPDSPASGVLRYDTEGDFRKADFWQKAALPESANSLLASGILQSERAFLVSGSPRTWQPCTGSIGRPGDSSARRCPEAASCASPKRIRGTSFSGWVPSGRPAAPRRSSTFQVPVARSTNNRADFTAGRGGRGRHDESRRLPAVDRTGAPPARVG
jgi:hypothetical protein